MTMEPAAKPQPNSTPIDPVRVLLVDDEPLARDSLRHLLATDPEVTIVGECAHGMEALAAIDEQAPDLVFLDIQMPEVDGFGVLARLPAQLDPEIVFVTAYDRHAVRAFEVHALDYLVKPVGRRRFAEALRHAKERLRQRRETQRLAAQRRGQDIESDSTASWRSLSGGDVTAGHLSRLAVRKGDRVRFVDTGEIDWVESADYYSRLHVGDASYLIRRSMKSLEDALDPTRFLRIHRGAIVRIDRVRELRRQDHGAYVVILRDGTELRLSRGRREALESLLEDVRRS